MRPKIDDRQPPMDQADAGFHVLPEAARIQATVVQGSGHAPK
jgi:hypothetical protein